MARIRFQRAHNCQVHSVAQDTRYMFSMAQYNDVVIRLQSFPEVRGKRRGVDEFEQEGIAIVLSEIDAQSIRRFSIDGQNQIHFAAS
jgi:hypothetical protein